MKLEMLESYFLTIKGIFLSPIEIIVMIIHLEMKISNLILTINITGLRIIIT